MIELKEEVGKSTVPPGDFNILFSATDKTRQKISKDTEDSKNTINQSNIIDIYKTLNSTKNIVYKCRVFTK